MTHSDDAPATRAEFHRQHQADAVAEAERLLARREELQGAWLNWVAGELYRLGRPPYAAMVRRELQRLAQG
ncbi:MULTISPECIES: hypothetical protein [Pseudomonas]|uniref:Uncharacterized protein n=3 Tax=Pseudomonas TaxID=286 RepID=A0A0B5KGI2_PSEDL|nr:MULTISPECIES: hypothetical protein [Pseudomonas]AEJ12402.1 conserved hypothetical protein [Pseudomonas putida S16]AHZ76599.1 hypothetical protein DW66_2081 [Pseudomonas putida]AJG14711.1 hypothetical protein RK21_03203 [Pseudomonas plecoglossicida]ESW36303.1 hypothetical protein O164_30670 [Pseudomonas taiwanensis SJ9]MBF8790976.1 hypothetical protein [Pseudomonas asiatica]